MMPPGLRFGDRAAGRENNFNLIRMCAASGVLVSHAWPISRGPGAVEPLQAQLHGLTLGTVCVYIFFAISGFFITKSFERSASIARFLLARALRLFPALVVVLGLTVLAGLWLTRAPAATYLAAVPEYLIRNLTLFRLQYALPGVFEANPYGPAINGSLWTLNYEVLCYLGVFLVGIAGLLRAPRGVAVVFVAVVALCLAVPLLPAHPRLVKLLDLGLPFALGAAAYIWRDR
ncbi:acyltransferase, partial [Pseudooceanicola lipolyticus]